jgi:hypothetical protein
VRCLFSALGLIKKLEEKMRFPDLFRSNLAFSSDCVVRTAESMFWAANHLRTCYLIRDLISGILVKSNQLPFVQIFPLVLTTEIALLPVTDQ